MRYYRTKDVIVLCLALVVIVAGFVAIPIIQAYNESATYNRLTGAHTTTWDAFWVQLRVQDSPKD